MPRSPRSPSKTTLPTLGSLGENFVARWAEAEGWVILERQWHCRWGELDLVMGQRSPTPSPSVTEWELIVFVEIKTRSSGNWDENGALAITSQKQAKLWRTAELFLSAHPTWAEVPCRFDVALVLSQRLRGEIDLSQINGKTVAIASGYRLTLQEYIPAAFS
ncbi:MAG: YraN family protein [Leptolyngbya sp.]|nr:MAG: YraN family protein [Leptolyngbya sp.]